MVMLHAARLSSRPSSVTPRRSGMAQGISWCAQGISGRQGRRKGAALSIGVVRSGAALSGVTMDRKVCGRASGPGRRASSRAL